jgi:hypothetical protein
MTFPVLVNRQLDEGNWQKHEQKTQEQIDI